MIKTVHISGLIIAILLIAGCMTDDASKTGTAKDTQPQKEADTAKLPTINVTNAMATTKDLQDLLSPTK